MAYIGKEPIVGNFQKCDAITVVNGQAAYTLQVSSTNVVPESANHMLVSLNGILQAPVTSFTVSGATLTFASNLATGDVIDFVILLGNVLDLGTPSDGTVTNAKLAQDIISGETALASTPADTDEFLVSDAGTLKRIDYSLIKGGITVAGQWRFHTDFTSSADPITSNWEEVDTTYSRIGSAMAESSGVFTFPSTGIYLVSYLQEFAYAGDSAYVTAAINLTTDNSSYSNIAQTTDSINYTSGNWFASASAQAMIDITNTTTHKVSFRADVSGTVIVKGNSTVSENAVTFIRLGDT